jgi:branched-chain amino acid transport system permease protein
MKRGGPWLGMAALMIAVAFLLRDFGYYTDQYRKLMLWVALALGFNFLFGIAGQVAFSHFAFYGIGAYSVVILTFKVGLPIPLSIVLGLGLCGLLAVAVGIAATRLEGFYLALATLAFAQLFIVVLVEGGTFTGGAGGFANYKLPLIEIGRWKFALTGPYYTSLIALMLLATFYILLQLDRSYFGRACRAIRDNPEAAAAMGVDVARTKIAVFAITSVLAGAAGMTYAFVDNIVNPPVFGLENVFLLLFMVIIGGSGRHSGAIIGAILLYILPFILSPLIGHHHALVFGIVMLAAMLFRSDGLIGLYDSLRARRVARARA